MLIASPFRPLARRVLSAAAALAATAAAAFAQTPSALDGFDPNVDGNVYVLATQPDGKIVVGGEFANFRTRDGFSVARHNLARLNADGTVDPTFNPNANGAVRALVLQPDGKIVVGGDFTTLQPNGAATATTRPRLARLNADGSLDAAFNYTLTYAITGGALTPQVFALALQPDGAIVVGGAFNGVQPGQLTVTFTRRNLFRILASGAVDPTYDPNPNASVLALAPHLDGKMVVGGGFTTFQENGKSFATTRGYMARLNRDGTVDSDFDPKAGNGVTCLAIQRDGKIVFGGYFTQIQPIGNDSPANRQHIARLNPDGTLDSEFYPNANASVFSLAVQPDGSLLVGGAFTAAWSRGSVTAARNNVARFLPDGSLDAAFNPNFNAEVDAFAFQSDGKLVVGGKFTRAQPPGAVNALVRNRLARLNADGSLDTDFQLDPGGRILVSVPQADGKVIIGGTFTNVGGVTHNYLARLNADGSVDNTYNPSLDGRVFAMAYEAGSGKVIIGGTFTTITHPRTGTDTRNHLARFNADGTPDSDFNVSFDGQVNALVEQSDGKIIVGGTFSNVQPFGASSASVRQNICRLTNSGSLDAAFHPNASAAVDAIALQSDGKVLVGGAFTSFTANVDLTPVTTTTGGTTTTTTPTGTPVSKSYFARLNTDGTLDTAFKPAINSTVSRIVVQSDGKIILGGLFTSLVGTDGTLVTTTNADGTKSTSTPVRHRLARLTTEGNLDPWDPNANNNVFALALQPDGKLLVGGAFTTLQPNGAPDWTLRKYAARLNTDGTLDSTFNLDLDEQSGNRVDSITVQSDGRILIGGNFLPHPDRRQLPLASAHRRRQQDSAHHPPRLRAHQRRRHARHHLRSRRGRLGRRHDQRLRDPDRRQGDRRRLLLRSRWRQDGQHRPLQRRGHARRHVQPVARRR